jgi:hypothetical protein
MMHAVVFWAVTHGLIGGDQPLEELAISIYRILPTFLILEK